MKKLFFLYFFSVLLCLSAHSSNAVEEITVTTFQDLKTALENSKGSNVKLGASIKVPSNYGSEIAIEIRSGEHFLNLNGFNIEYYYTNNAREYDGVPIFADSNLTINGEGTITGGYVALQASNHGLITLNGGNYVAKAASGIRVQGPIIINKGTFSGRFGQIWLEGGMVVDNANAIHDIDYTFKRGGVVIKNGVATGKTQLERVQVSLSNITMAEGSEIILGDESLLNINGNLIGESRIKLQGGFLTKNNSLTLNTNTTLSNNLKVATLIVEKGVYFTIADGKTLTITTELTNKGYLSILQGGNVVVEGKVINEGTIDFSRREAFLVKSSFYNIGNYIANYDSNPMYHFSQDLLIMEEAANELYELGLFRGVSTDENGTPNFDLLNVANRQVAITMLVRLLGKEEEALASDLEHPFSDVDEWASPYVGYAYQHQLTNGISESLFGAKNLITSKQYLTFLLRVLGYSDRDGDFSWQDPETLGNEVGIHIFDNAQVLLRGDLANLSRTALYAGMKDKPYSLREYLFLED